MKQFVVCIMVLFTLCSRAKAQPYYSLSTDFSILHSFSPQQHFTAVGQTVIGTMHITKKESLYALICYYTNGKFKNSTTAFADSGIVIPNRMNYTVFSHLRYRQVSLGWKHYFVGGYDADNNWNLYGLAGFGLLLAQANNTFSVPIDAVLYKSVNEIKAGTGNFKRLTFDLGLGAELPLGNAIFIYSELRSWLSASDYPSPYLFNNDKVPFVFTLNTGIRVLMD